MVCSRDLIECLPGNPACPQWKPRDEGDSILLAMIHHIIPLTIGEAITVLHRNNGDDPARPLDVLLSDVRQSDKPNLSFALELRQGSHRILERYDWIRMMQLIDVNTFHSQPLQAALKRLKDVLTDMPGGLAELWP